jgi:hypothetical protein
MSYVGKTTRTVLKELKTLFLLHHQLLSSLDPTYEDTGEAVISTGPRTFNFPLKEMLV